MVRRIWVQRKEEFQSREQRLCTTISTLLGLQDLQRLDILYRYDIDALETEQFEQVGRSLLSSPQRDVLRDTVPPCDWLLGVEMLPGQFDQRADSAKLCIELLYPGRKVQVRCATYYAFTGRLTEEEKARLRSYFINPVEAREADPALPGQLSLPVYEPDFPPTIAGFCAEANREKVLNRFNLAMDADDLALVQTYFREQGREPTFTELKVIDTYWSDHCRHTTFLTELDQVTIEDPQILATFAQYLEARRVLGNTKPITLMDLATIAAKQLKREGKLDRLDVSEEINACSVQVDVQTEVGSVPYLLQFKNETHNHPTEIEPFGGAATCIGGAIRDPLSGRSYVYQAMRISGCADPRTPFEQTLPGKLPQRTIALGSAHGYSSYGNQVGLATGMVEELYHPRFLAKHMELGFVLGAVPAAQVRRESPVPGDVVIVVGGRTGRDGCGGATGSSKGHDHGSLERCGSEVQRGNAPEERKIQRLMRKSEVSLLIKRCNDFGAGGVSVAIGELADGLVIDLDALPTKYDGLDGTERAISESQERMAMVVASEDALRFIQLANEENLEAVIAAHVVEEPMLVMLHQGRELVRLHRSLLASNGAKKHAHAYIPASEIDSFERPAISHTMLQILLGDLNVASKQALGQRFDGTIGSSTLFMPYGGKTQSTPIQTMAALIPVSEGTTSTASLASWGCDPYELERNPYRGSFLSVVHSLAKVVAAGGDWQQMYLTFQEYFGRVGSDPAKWGVVLSALLGAYKAQRLFGKAAIGGKDSMSGSFGDLDVPPTLVSFAVSVGDSKGICSPEFKKAGSTLMLLQADSEEMLPSLFAEMSSLVKQQKVLSAWALGYGGIAEALAKMSLGNRIGCKLTVELDIGSKRYGSFLVETDQQELPFGKAIGYTIAEDLLDFGSVKEPLSVVQNLLAEPLSTVYGDVLKQEGDNPVPTLSSTRRASSHGKQHCSRPNVLIPVFAGTNCEYDAARAWRACGGEPEILVINTLDARRVAESVQNMVASLKQSQILFLPGGFSAADEPDGSGKFIAAFLRNPAIADAISGLLSDRDGLVGGICNGFQALVQMGLLPYGSIVELGPDDPMLVENLAGNHISRLVYSRVSSVLSPWLSEYRVGEVHLLPISHGEGRFFAPKAVLDELAGKGQIACQYSDGQGNVVPYASDNPNGSLYAVEALSSADGKVFGRMAHSERMVDGLYLNTPAKPDLGLFRGAVRYFL